MKIHAISLWQPWASLVACGAKSFETRSWPVPLDVGTPLLIHAASRGAPRFLGPELEALCVRRFGRDWRKTIPRGAFVALVELGRCWPTKHVRQRAYKDEPFAGADERRMGDWSDGRFAWELDGARMLSPPVPSHGRQRLWYVSCVRDRDGWRPLETPMPRSRKREPGLFDDTNAGAKR